MPKVFLVRKLRQHWKAASCGIVTPPPSPEQATTANTTTVGTKVDQNQHQSAAELRPRNRWTETWQKQRTRAEGGRGEAETTPPVSPCNLPSPNCNPPSPISNSERFRPHFDNTTHSETQSILHKNEVIVEEPTSSSCTPPLPNTAQPAYMAVPVIQTLAAQDRPLDYHVPRVRHPKNEPDDSTILSQSRVQQHILDQELHHQLQQQHASRSSIQVPDSQEDSHSDGYPYDMRPVSPGDSDSNSSRSPDSLLDERGEKMAMIPSLPVRLALLQQRLGLPTDVPQDISNG